MMKKIILLFMVCMVVGLPAYESNIYLEALRTFSAQSLYLTFTSIDTISEDYYVQTMEKDEALNLLEGYIRSVEQADHQIQRLFQEGYITGSDIAYFEDMDKCFLMLDQSASSLKKFITSDNEGDKKKYTKQQNDAWEKIAALLKIK